MKLNIGNMKFIRKYIFLLPTIIKNRSCYKKLIIYMYLYYFLFMFQPLGRNFKYYNF